MDANAIARHPDTANCLEGNVMINSNAALNDTEKDHHKSYPDVRVSNTVRSSKCKLVLCITSPSSSCIFSPLVCMVRPISLIATCLLPAVMFPFA